MSKKKDTLFDKAIRRISPKWAYSRKKFAAAYEILNGSRYNNSQPRINTVGGTELTEYNLHQLRDRSRYLSQNNPIAKGILKTEASGVVGSDTSIQAKTADDGWNDEAEALWKEEMIENPCDVTGRYNFHVFLEKAFRHYRRDGDAFVIFTKDGLQGVGGECVGTPYNVKQPTSFEIINGIAMSKLTGKFLGCYVGKASKWGYIESGSYKKYNAQQVHHFMNSEYFSSTRGEPILTPSIKYIDRLTSYIDAEVVAANINACFTVFVATKENSAKPENAYTGGNSSGTDDKSSVDLESIGNGTVFYGEPGESATAIAATRPAQQFDPFVLRMLSFIGRPLCLPMALVSLDFAGITNVNARLIFSEARDNWKNEQNFVVRPFVQRAWRYKIDEWIADGKLSDRKDKYANEIYLKRWPYVDPFKEANSDRLRLESGVTTRTQICAREGYDWKDVVEEREFEERTLEKKKLILKSKAPTSEEKVVLDPEKKE